MFQNKNQILAILHQYVDISTAEEKNKLDLNLFTCNYILDITVISSGGFLKF